MDFRNAPNLEPFYSKHYACLEILEPQNPKAAEAPSPEAIAGTFK